MHCNAVLLVISKQSPNYTMQRLLQGRNIEENDRKQAILGIISDQYCRLILQTTIDKPKCAMEIATESKIPISTAYRRLQTLYDNKLLKISGTISDNGKKYFLYKSKVKAISALCDCSDIKIEIIPNKNETENLERGYYVN